MTNWFIEAVDNSCRSLVFTKDGIPLSRRDSYLMQLSFTLQGALLGDLLPGHQALRTWRGFLGNRAIDVVRLAKTLKWVQEWLRNYPGHYLDNPDPIGPGAPRDVSSFKQTMQDQSLYWGFMAPLSPILSEFFTQFSAEHFRTLNQWVSFLRHITLRDADFRDETIEDYVQLEMEMCDWVYDQDLVQELNAIVREWTSDLMPETLLPSHGPGATASVRRGSGRAVKYREFHLDRRLNYILRRFGDEAPLYPPGSMSDLSTSKRISVLQCVPKSLNANRAISMEPTVLQFYQHGFSRLIDEWMQGHEVLSGRVDLHDQSASRQLALEGSSSGAWSTFDLSSASDTVTLPLIKGMFANTPLLPMVIGTRSDWTRLPDGRLIHVVKSSPMGSSMCFPVMVVVFAAICELVVRRTLGRASRWKDYRVYGDDIIIDDRCSDEFLNILDLLHFKVNRSKSFWGREFHNFREACGIECVDGVDVTPIRASRRMRLDVSQNHQLVISSVETVSSFCSLANLAFERGYWNVRKSTLSILRLGFRGYNKMLYTTKFVPELERFQRSTYVFPLSSTAIRTFETCCTNFRLRSRIGPLQVPEVRALTAAQSHPKSPTSEDDENRYWEWWLTLPDRPRRVEWGVELCSELSSGFYPTRQQWRESWIPEL